jgi:hypothetical protein
MKLHLLIPWLVLGAGTAFAQYTNRSSVLDGSGGRSTGGVYTNLSAAGQPGGIAVTSGGPYVNQAGFLNTFFLRPGLDSDHDGLANEADPDNDNDGLADATENAGAAFSPTTVTDLNLPDSDGDGMSDLAESVAGTNPLDLNALLEIVRIQRSAGAEVAWVARSNKTYRVLYAAAPTQPVTNLLDTVTATAFAAPPWYVLTNTISDSGAATTRVYAVQALP